MGFRMSAVVWALLVHPAFGFTPAVDHSDVSVRFESPEQKLLVVEGRTYLLRFDLTIAAITQFQSGDETLIGKYALLPIMNTGAVKGPGRARIERLGPYLCEVHVQDLTWTDYDADIEIILYCYAKRVFAVVEVVPRSEGPAIELGWLGSVAHSVDILSYEDDYASKLVQGGVRPRVSALVPRQLTAEGRGVPTRIALNPPERLMTGSRYPSEFEGVRRAVVILVAGETHEDLVDLATVEASAARYQFEVSGGRFNGYRQMQGYFEIAAELTASGGTDGEQVTRTSDYTLDFLITAPKKLPPADLICKINTTTELPGAAILVDHVGYPLPVPMQVSRNGNTASTDGKQSSEVYAPVFVAPGKSFSGGMRFVDRWGRLPLKQLTSEYYPQPVLQTSQGQSVAFSYMPFGSPYKDRGNYVILPSGSMHGFDTPLCGIELLRYKSGGRWVENRLLDTRFYLTSPIAANVGFDYVSDDGKVKTTIDVFEGPPDDEARSFITLVIDVLEPVVIDGGSARNLRILGAGAYDGRPFGPDLAYTSPDGVTVVTAVGAEISWPLEAVPMAEGSAFVSAYARPEGNLAYVINRVSGVFGGNPITAFGLSSSGGDHGMEFFLTAPDDIERLEAGDHLEAHLFVMPFGDADSDYHPAAEQAEWYGEGLATLNVVHGVGTSGYPLAMRADPRDFAEFVIEGGAGQIPVFIDGFRSHRGFMLWEKVGSDWVFRDQQVHGNDWYQTFRAKDGSVGVVIVVESGAGESHHYAIGQASSANTIILRNEFVTIQGGPLDFVSPVRFGGLINAPLDGTDLIRCSGLVNEATQE